MNWFELNAVLPLKSESQVQAMLDEEVNVHKRPTFVTRIHQRYTVLRAARERKELLAKVKKHD